MKEYNNRQKANKFAEYITGRGLRKYLAKKVERYCVFWSKENRITGEKELE